MPTIFGFGSTLVSEQKLDSLTPRELRGLTARAGVTSVGGRAGGNPFSPIGLGKPVSVEISHVSTGGLAAGSLLGGKPDLMVTSAVKRLPIFESAPRAVNVIVESVQKGFKFSEIAATQAGTPLIYHSPALTDRGTAVTVELVFDRFPAEVVKQVGSLLGSAAGIPLFAPAGAYAMAGKVLLGLAGKLVEKLGDGKAAFSQTLTIDSGRPGLEDTKPGFAILTDSGDLLSQADRGVLEFAPGDGLRDTTTGEPYDGPAAYVVLSLDGSERPDYANFAPTMASAALLERFLHVGEKQSTATDLVLQSMQAFNDLHFRGEAERTKRQIAQVGDGSPESKNLKTLFDAYVKNISDSDLRPKL